MDILSFDNLQEAGYNPRTSLIKRARITEDGKPLIDDVTKLPMTEDRLETTIVNSKGFPLKDRGETITGVGNSREESMRDAIAKASKVLDIPDRTKTELEILKERLAALEARANAPLSQPPKEAPAAQPEAIVTAVGQPEEDDDLDDFDDDEELEDTPFDEDEDEE